MMHKSAIQLCCVQLCCVQLCWTYCLYSGAILTTKHAYAASAKVQGADPESSRAAGSGPHHVTLALGRKCLCLDSAVLSLYLIFGFLQILLCLLVPLLRFRLPKSAMPELLSLGFASLVLSPSSCSHPPPVAILLFCGFSCYYYFLATKRIVQEFGQGARRMARGPCRAAGNSPSVHPL